MGKRFSKTLYFLTLCLFLATSASAQFRVLLYHAHSSFGFSESVFIQDMDFLLQNDYHTVNLDQFYNWLVNNEPMPIRPLVITFDDNYIGVYEIAYPVLKDRGFVATNFAHTDYVGVGGANDHCDWSEIQEMESAGVFITESHTKTHSRLTTLSEEEASAEIEGSKLAIETNLANKICKFIAYPYGSYNSTIITLCQNAGYTAGFAVGNGINYHNTALFELQRIDLANIDFDTFKERIGYNLLPPSSPGKGWTIDNEDVNFFFDPDEWTLSTEVSGYYGLNYRVHSLGDGSHKARWAAYLPKSGNYHIHAWWTQDSDNTTSATYEIHHLNGVSNVIVNQQENGGQWNLLGNYQFSAKKAAEIFLSDTVDGQVVADGVWFQPVSESAYGWFLH